MEEKKTETPREDLDAVTSSHKGLAGLFERALRRFRLIVPLVVLVVMYALTAVLMGISLALPLYLLHLVWENTQHLFPLWQYILVGTTLAAGYFLFGFILIFVLPLANIILPTTVKPWRGGYYSLNSVPWYIHNGLTYIARYSFLPFITPTPFNVMFYKMMGMKVGKNVQINTTHVSDPALLHLEDKVTIGGSVTLVGHYGSGGYLILAPVHIRKGATVGLKAIIMGDVEIGENARILPNSVVMPKTKIPAGEIWGGVPAEFISKKKQASEKKS